MHNFGKFTMERRDLDVNGVHHAIGVFYDVNHNLWQDVVSHAPHNWYVAIDDSGTVVSAERDYEMSQISGFTILGLDDLGGFENREGNYSVYGKHWNGKKIVEKE